MQSHRDGVPPEARWFCLSVGMGLDADTVAAVERRRAAGARVTSSLYARRGARELYRRRGPARLGIGTDGAYAMPSVADAVNIGNQAPWSCRR